MSYFGQPTSALMAATCSASSTRAGRMRIVCKPHAECWSNIVHAYCCSKWTGAIDRLPGGLRLHFDAPLRFEASSRAARHTSIQCQFEWVVEMAPAVVCGTGEADVIQLVAPCQSAQTTIGLPQLLGTQGSTAGSGPGCRAWQRSCCRTLCSRPTWWPTTPRTWCAAACCVQ